MKKLLSFILTILIIMSVAVQTQASLVSDRQHRIQQAKENNKSIKEIKNFLKEHDNVANKHDLDNLKLFYDEKYENNDGYKYGLYFETIKKTWDVFKDITYTTDIVSIDTDGTNASVFVNENAFGTALDMIDGNEVTGEIHSKSKGIYYLEKINDKWYIQKEVAIDEESSYLYGDARFYSIDMISPNVVSSGETYSASVSVDVDKDKNVYAIGSIDHDLVSYPPNKVDSKFRPLKTNTLERYIKSNNQNINEFVVATLVFSKIKNPDKYNASTKIYVSGMASLMKRVNVIPANNYIKEDSK